MATSTKQVVPLVEIWDYYLATGDPASGSTAKGKTGRQVKATLQYDRALTLAPDPIVWVAQETVYTALTDGNGFWHLFLVPNNKITPANTYYTIEIEGGLTYKIQVTDVAVPGVGWQSSAAGILLDIPAALAATTSTVGAITATGLITAQAGISITAGGLTVVGGETVSGGEVLTGGLTVDQITMTAAVSRIIPGATSFAIRDTANANDNLSITNAGGVTVRQTLTILNGALIVNIGNLILQPAVAKIVGGFTSTSIRDSTDSNDNLLISGAGAVTVRNGLTVTAGDLTLTAGELIFADAVSQIIPGATSLSLRNNAGGADNLLLTDAGLATFRNAVSVPPSAGAALPTTLYGTLPVKLDDQSTDNTVTNITLTVPAGGLFPVLELFIRGRTSDAAAAFANITFNGDAGPNYDTIYQTDINTTQTGAAPLIGGNSIQIPLFPPSGAVAGSLGTAVVTITAADSATLYKQLTWNTGHWNANSAAGSVLSQGAGQWRNITTAITSITITVSAGFLVKFRAILRGNP